MWVFNEKAFTPRHVYRDLAISPTPALGLGVKNHVPAPLKVTGLGQGSILQSEMFRKVEVLRMITHCPGECNSVSISSRANRGCDSRFHNGVTRYHKMG